jgi:alkylated DNA repair dioxygenase AlkB
VAGEREWPEGLANLGTGLLAELGHLVKEAFSVVAFQGYRNGAGCPWHADTPFDAQAVLSLGATRTFGVRRPGEDPQWTQVNHGDLVYMPPGFQNEWEHTVAEEDADGERCSLVFRTKARD